ncbi:MAG: FtsW/RodA/SpoVE family cell cycle protein, partial [Luteolibacter sp.]
MNWPLVFVMYALLVCGVFVIESAARHLSVSAEVLAQYGSAGAYYAAMQKKWIVLGSVVFFSTALIDYRWIRWLGIPLYLVSLALMAMAMLADDKVHRLNLMGLSFQPAQLGVASGIILMAWLLQALPKVHPWLGAPAARISIIGGIALMPFLMVMKMGDMGSALVWVPVALVALVVGGAPFRYLTLIASLAAG